MKISKSKLIKYIIFAPLVLVAVIYLYPQYYYVLDTNNDDIRIIEEPVFKEGSVGVYLINLDRSKERLEFVKQFVDKLKYDIHRIPAVDGNTMRAEELNDFVDFETYKQIFDEMPNLGTIGCSLSHYKTYETFLKSNYEFALVFEDDVSFYPPALQYAVEQSIQNRNLWDIVSFSIFAKGNPKTIKTYPNNQRLSVYLKEVTNAGAYLINRQSAKKLLQTAYPIKMPIDHHFTRGWEMDTKFTGIERPRIAYQVFGYSEIDNSYSIKHEELPFTYRIQKSIYRFQTYSMKLIYNLKLYYKHAEKSLKQ